MTDTTLPPGDFVLGGEFPQASRDAWRAAVDKVLKGADFEKRLVGATLEGVRIDPLTTRSERPGDGDPEGAPGFAPFTRGARPIGAGTMAWDIRQRHDHPDAEAANRHILNDLERGVTSIQLAVDLGSTSGGRGVLIPHIDILDRALKDVLLDLAPVVLETEEDGLVAAALIMDLWRRRGHQGEDIRGALNMDPLGCLARSPEWSLTGSMAETLARAGALADQARADWPQVTSFLVDTRPYHDAGAGEAQELAAALASGLTYVRTMEAAGFTLEEAFRRILFTFAVDTDVFLSIAKLRAARRLWGRVAAACGVTGDAGAMAIHAVTSERMMAARDPWVNILRTTHACFAAGVGGADHITVLPFTAAINRSNNGARRIARNIQIILMEETGLGRVMDPAGGAWALEQLTDRLGQKAWSDFQTIEAEGGMAASLVSGAFARRIGEIRSKRNTAIATRSRALTGVSEFPALEEPEIAFEAGDVMEIYKAADDAVRARQADGRGDAACAALAGAGNAPPQEQMTQLRACIAAGAVLGVLDHTLRHIATGPVPHMAEPLIAHRLAAPYEALRTAADGQTAKTGSRPTVLLIPLGDLADSTARTTFARNFYAAGGLDAHDPGPLSSAEDAAAAFAAHPSALTVLCSSADVYGDRGASTVEALRRAGAGHIIVAGRPGEIGEDVQIDRFIYTGCDVLEALGDAHQHLGIDPAPVSGQGAPS